MPLALEKDIAIRIFLKGVSNLKFIRLVQDALSGWKIANPTRDILGILIPEDLDLNEKMKLSSDKCCLFGAALIGKTSRYYINMAVDDEIDTTAITTGFDNPEENHEYEFAIWAAKISKIIFDD